MSPNVSVGDREVALRGTILRGEVGSGAHGMAIAGTDDRDEMGVYVEREDQVLGLAPSAGHYVSRTQREGVRSGPGDLDLVLYALRKFLRLATAGHPTILTVLYLPDYEVLDQRGEQLLATREAIVSRRAGRRYLGYLEGQRERVSFAEALRRVDEVRDRLAAVVDGPVSVPDEPDLAWVSAMMRQVQLDTWGWRRP